MLVLRSNANHTVYSIFVINNHVSDINFSDGNVKNDRTLGNQNYQPFFVAQQGKMIGVQ